MSSTREKIFNLTNNVEKLMRENGCNTSGLEMLETLKHDMDEDFFTILVVGEFKRGKLHLLMLC